MQYIVSPGHKGHRLMYVAVLAEEVVRCGRIPHLILQDGVTSSDEFVLHLGHLAERSKITELQRFDVRSIRDVVDTGTRLPTIFAEADTWILPLVLRAPRWPGGTNLVIMRPRGSGRGPLAALSGMAKLAVRVFARAMTNHRAWVLTSSTVTAPRRHEVRDPIVFVGDWVRANELRARWRDDTTGAVERWVGILGGIGERKNVHLVADAVAGLPDAVGLIVAGAAEDTERDVEHWLRPVGSQGRAVRIAGHLTDEELDSIILALDCVVLAHSNEGPSGILGRAVVAGTPAVTAGARTLRADARRSPGQIQWVPLDVSALSVAILRALGQGRRDVYKPKDRFFAERLVGSQ